MPQFYTEKCSQTTPKLHKKHLDFTPTTLRNTMKNSEIPQISRCFASKKVRDAEDNFLNKHYPIVLKRTLALTSASARIESAGISFGE